VEDPHSFEHGGVDFSTPGAGITTITQGLVKHLYFDQFKPAKVYFHKSFAQLTEDEYIAIVAMIIAPETFNIEKFPDRNKARANRIKRLISGEYKPRGLFDLYYGPLDAEIQNNIPPLSYFKFYYD